jgi:hypothetical protein
MCAYALWIVGFSLEKTSRRVILVARVPAKTSTTRQQSPYPDLFHHTGTLLTPLSCRTTACLQHDPFPCRASLASADILPSGWLFASYHRRPTVCGGQQQHGGNHRPTTPSQPYVPNLGDIPRVRVPRPEVARRSGSGCCGRGEAATKAGEELLGESLRNGSGSSAWGESGGWGQ